MRALLAAILLTWPAIGVGRAEPHDNARNGSASGSCRWRWARRSPTIATASCRGLPRRRRAACASWSSRKAPCAGKDGDNPALVDEAASAIRRAAREHRVYVLCGGASYSPKAKRDVCWMFVAGPDGREVFRYDKLYDKHDAKMPGVFHIDGIPCGTMICADRWLRGVEEIPIQQGAQISFELSCNFASEWVAPFQWYWYVPRALRNNVWVVFANSGNKVSGVSDTSDRP